MASFPGQNSTAIPDQNSGGINNQTPPMRPVMPYERFKPSCKIIHRGRIIAVLDGGCGRTQARSSVVLRRVPLTLKRSLAAWTA